MGEVLAVSRREFVSTAAKGGTALIVAFYLPASGCSRTAQQQDQQKKPVNPFNAYVRVSADDRVALVVEKSEMGQGVMTALPMILAEELCVDWKTVQVEQAPTNPAIYDHGTGGSGSVAGLWLPLRRAGAAAREMLIAAAAQRWNVLPETCKAREGSVVHGARKDTFTYGQLVADASKLPIPNFNTVPLKNPDDFTIVGHDERRYEARAKATGAAKFGLDSRPPGMLFAVVARCPVFGGKPAKFDAAKAKAIRGVRDVIQIEAVGSGAFTAGGIVVLAETSWAAIQGRNALEITWDEGPNVSESSGSLHQRFVENASSAPVKVVRDDGDAGTALASAAKRIEAVYELPFAAHATMEPMNCTIHVRPDGA
ncbi:MAG TPA: molybdopterin cofactor-binding domain-containing protein, partial [Methylomirabilota bacterium]|nr:molybdopterin cofactor-binding domain-containing protein [Methylomirabilota bacterium]